MIQNQKITSVCIKFSQVKINKETHSPMPCVFIPGLTLLYHPFDYYYLSFTKPEKEREINLINSYLGFLVIGFILLFKRKLNFNREMDYMFENFLPVKMVVGDSFRKWSLMSGLYFGGDNHMYEDLGVLQEGDMRTWLDNR